MIAWDLLLVLELSKMLWKEEVEVAGVQIVLSGFDPGNLFQALWKFLCSCSSGQSLNSGTVSEE